MPHKITQNKAVSAGKNARSKSNISKTTTARRPRNSSLASASVRETSATAAIKLVSKKATAAPRQKKPVQDSEREILQAATLGLVRTGIRLGVDSYDILGNAFEQKVTTKSGTSTARNTGPKTLGRWRCVNWVISRGNNYIDGFEFTDHYFLAPEHMEAWYRGLEEKFAKADGFRDKVLRLCRDGLTVEEIARLNKIHYDGMLLNDPNIPWSYVKKHGIRLEGDLKSHLLELAKQFPLAS